MNYKSVSESVSRVLVKTKRKHLGTEIKIYTIVIKNQEKPEDLIQAEKIIGDGYHDKCCFNCPISFFKSD